MSRSTSVNYTTYAFTWATALTDLFKATDVQLLGQMFEAHTHETPAKGLQIPAGGIATNAVTTVKILDSNVTTAKIADSAVTGAKIAASSTIVTPVLTTPTANNPFLIGHLLGSQLLPTLTAGAALGSGPPSLASAVTAGSSDIRGGFEFGTGSSATTGVAVRLTFNQAYGQGVFAMVMPANTATQALGLYISDSQPTYVEIGAHTAPANSQGVTTYQVHYLFFGNLS